MNQLKKHQGDIDRLKTLMEQLRDKEDGCPWDIEQNFKSIAPHTIEESYEVVDAIERNDIHNLKEELGDLLFQVIFHSQIAKELGHFDFDEVVESITQKMISRHPHVFASAVVKTAKEQEVAWEEHKRQEKLNKGQEKEGLLASIPVGMPAMLRAYKIQKKAAKVGFDFEKIEDVFAKLNEEISELKVELAKINDVNHIDSIENEIGDILFAAVNVARKLGIDPDVALRRTNRKFMSRFRYIEEALEREGRAFDQMSLKELDRLWDEAKSASI